MKTDVANVSELLESNVASFQLQGLEKVAALVTTEADLSEACELLPEIVDLIRAPDDHLAKRAQRTTWLLTDEVPREVARYEDEVDSLLAQLEDDPSGVGSTIVRILEPVAECCPRVLTGSVTADPLSTIAESGDREERRAAYRLAGASATDGCLALLSGVDDPDDSVRAPVEEALNRTVTAALANAATTAERFAAPLEDGQDSAKGPEFQELVAALDHPNKACQRYAVWAISELAQERPRTVVDAGALPGVVALLDHSDEDVRTNATRVINRIARERPAKLTAVDIHRALSNAIEQGPEPVRQRAAESIARITAERPDAVLDTLLSEGDGPATAEAALSPVVNVLGDGDTRARRAITDMLAVLSETRPSALVSLQDEIRAHIRATHDDDPGDDGATMETLLKTESRIARGAASSRSFDEVDHFEATIDIPDREIVLGDESPDDPESADTSQSGESETDDIASETIAHAFGLTADEWQEERPNEYRRLHDQLWNEEGPFSHCGLDVDSVQVDDDGPPVPTLTVAPAMSTDLVGLLSQFAVDFGRTLQDRLAE